MSGFSVCAYFFGRFGLGRNMAFINFTPISRERQLASFTWYFQVGLGTRRVKWKGNQL